MERSATKCISERCPLRSRDGSEARKGTPWVGSSSTLSPGVCLALKGNVVLFCVVARGHETESHLRQTLKCLALVHGQDVDWKDDLTFATCSTDKAIHTCVVGEEYPRQTFTGMCICRWLCRSVQQCLSWVLVCSCLLRGVSVGSVC